MLLIILHLQFASFFLDIKSILVLLYPYKKAAKRLPLGPLRGPYIILRGILPDLVVVREQMWDNIVEV